MEALNLSAGKMKNMNNFQYSPLFLQPPIPEVDLSKTIDVRAFIEKQQKFPVYSIDVPQSRYDSSLDSRLRRLDLPVVYSEPARLEKPTYLSERPFTNYDESNKIKMLSYKGNSQNYSLSA